MTQTDVQPSASAEMCACGFWPAGQEPPGHSCRKRIEFVFSSPLDPGIERIVHLLMDNGIETYESCQGGEGHGGGAGTWPVVRFGGVYSDGFRALAVALMYDLPVYALNRVWRVEGGEPTGPSWELVFHPERLARQNDANSG